MWPFSSGFKINVYSEGLSDCFAYKVKDHFTVGDVMTRAFSQFKIENDGNYALFVTSSDHPGAIPVPLDANEQFGHLKKNYNPEEHYFILQHKTQNLSKTEHYEVYSPSSSTKENDSKSNESLYPTLSLTDNGPEFVNPDLPQKYNGISSNSHSLSAPQGLHDWNIVGSPPVPRSPSSSNQKSFSNLCYSPLSRISVQCVRDPSENLPPELQSLNLASLSTIPHDVINCRPVSNDILPIDLTLERDLLHSIPIILKKEEEACIERKNRIQHDEELVAQEIERELQQKREEEVRRKEEEERERQLELERKKQLQIQKEKERQEMLERQKRLKEEQARLEKLKQEQYEEEQRQLRELQRLQEEERRKVEALRKEKELREAKLREEMERKRIEQEFVEQLYLFEKQKKEAGEAPPPYRPPQNTHSNSNPNILLDLSPDYNTPNIDPFIKHFIDLGHDKEATEEAVKICGKVPQQVAGYLSEYQYYANLGYSRQLIYQALRLFGSDRTQTFQFFNSFNRVYSDTDLIEALNYFQGDFTLTAKFLSGLSQLQEMGLENSKAKAALYSTRCDVQAAAAVVLESS